MSDFKALLAQLNPKQSQAARTRGKVLLEARAGTGKTAVGACRVAFALQEGNCLPHETLTLTFTNKAAQEFRTRLLEKLPEEGHLVRISTFHRLALTIIEIRQGEQVKILGPNERLRLLVELVHSFLKKNPKPAETVRNNFYRTQPGKPDRVWVRPEQLAREAAQEITSLKARGVSLAQGQFISGVKPQLLPLIQQIGPLYHIFLTEHQLLDLDDLVPLATHHLKTAPELTRVPGVGVKLIVVDEVQDIETSRLELLLALLRASQDQLKVAPEILAVGDELQRIYCLAGAGSYLWLEQSLPGAFRLDLEEQYRYGPTINAAANRLATALGCDRPVKAWRACDDPEGLFQKVLTGLALPDLAQGQLPIALYVAEDESEEALFLAEEIQKLQALNPSACIGVLVYTHKQLHHIAAAIKALKIEFHIKIREFDQDLVQGEGSSASSSQPVTQARAEKEPKISLMTIYAAKGLAFDVVMLPGLAHGLFPSNASNARRDLMLLLVGLTRTRYLTYLSYPKVAVNQAGRVEKTGPSPFLSLLPPILQKS